MHMEVIESYRSVWRLALYNKAKESDDETLRAARDYENFSGIENLIKSFLKTRPFEHHLVISLGCGTAKDLAGIGELFPSSALFGIDTSQDALSAAKTKLASANVNLICASMSHLPFKEDTRFDMLIAGQSLDLKFEEDYLKRVLTEATKYSLPKSRFYMTFYGVHESDLELYACTPIGNLLDELGWNIFHGREYHTQKKRNPFAQGVFWVAERLR
jgi:hypothetical protein